MNRDEMIQAQQQFIAEFTKLNKEEQLDFLRFNRYHHLRPINEVISIYIQNPEARILGSFDFWKDLSNESSVQFGQKASVRLWDTNGRVQEVLFDLAQTILVNPLEIKSTLLSNRVLVNTLADISGHDYLLGNRNEDEFLESSTTFIKDYIDRTVTNLSGYSERQRSVALSIAQYNIFEEFGAYLDTGLGHEDFSNFILSSFSKLTAEDNLLRTFSLANSFSRQLTKLINERYEQVSSLTDDLMLNQATLNESIEEITADVDFDVVNDGVNKIESVSLDSLQEIEQEPRKEFPSFNSEQIWVMKEIIPTFYPDFPSETTDEELVTLVEQMRDTLATDSNLRESAKVNTYRVFESSLNDSIGAYLLEHHSDNKALFNFLLNHQPIDFPRVIGKQIYEHLQDTVALKTEKVSKSDTMLEKRNAQTERAPSTQEIVKNIEEYNQIVEHGYTQLYDSYIHYQDLKLKGQNVSGAYDTFDFKTTKGEVQLGYNYIGREQGTNDDSKVIFWVSTDLNAYSTVPMSTPIRSRVFHVFEEAGQALNFENTPLQNNEAIEDFVDLGKTPQKATLDRVEFLNQLKEALISETHWDKFSIGTLTSHPELTENDVVLTIYDFYGVPNVIASMDLEGHLDTFGGTDELIENQTGIKDFKNQLIAKSFALRDEFVKEKGLPLPKEPYTVTNLQNKEGALEVSQKNTDLSEISNTPQRSKVAEIEWNESNSNENFEFINQGHDHAPINRSVLEAMIRDEIKLEKLNETGGYKVKTTLGRIYLGEGFESNSNTIKNFRMKMN